MEIGLAVIVGFATVVNAIALIYDVVRRHKVTVVSFVQVPNKNEGGIEEFRTSSSNRNQGTIVDCIKIKADNTVEIAKDGQVYSYGRYIKWQK